MSHAVLKLSDLVRPELIVDLPESGKNETLEHLCKVASRDPRVCDANAFYRAILNREAQASTGIGMGLAIPHAKIPEISDYLVVIGRSRSGIEFAAVDGKLVNLIFLIGTSDRQIREFVRLLAAVTHVLKDDDTRMKLINAVNPEEFINFLRVHESGIVS